MTRIPSLDGLRALSISLVILGHLSGTSGFPADSYTLMMYSNFGVRVFFVISGYLITSLLIKEHERSGAISLRAFYIRRAWRIFPASFAYLAIVAALRWNTMSHTELLAAATYTINYVGERSWLLGHLWSLAVEEQFYLLWPFALTLAWKKRAWIAAAVVALGPLVRVGFYFAGMTAGNGKYFPAVADCLAAGCLVSILEPKLRAYVGRRWFVVVPLLTCVLPLTHTWLKFYWSIGLSLMQIGVSLSVLHCIERRYWILNVRPVVWVGVLSYSLYLWQQPFLNRTGTSWVNACPANLFAALGAACISYYLVERPCLRLRDSFRTVVARKAVQVG
jgi:peptidoglycan/LPS O-acetylase OafA/YrhL